MLVIRKTDQNVFNISKDYLEYVDIILEMYIIWILIT